MIRMVIITNKIRLRFNDKSYDEFVRLYDERVKTCRAIYNWAVCECADDDRRAYMQGKGKPYLDKANRKLAKQVANQAGVGVKDILNLVRFQMVGHGWYYPDDPDDPDIRYGLEAMLTERRRAEDWVRKCPRLYEMGAISDAVTARERSISDNSDRIPFRPKGRAAPLVCLSNQKINRRGSHTITIPGFKLHTAEAIPKKWDMRSYRLVETAPYRTRGRRTFELHVQVRQEAKQQPVNVAARAVDVGGKHVAVTADTVSHTTIQTMSHLDLLIQIDRLKSRRDSYKRGGRMWHKINKRIRIKQNKAGHIKDNALHQGAAVVRGALKVIMDDVD